MFSLNLLTTIYSFKPAEEKNSPEQSPYDASEFSDDKTQSDFVLIDTQHNSLKTADEDR